MKRRNFLIGASGIVAGGSALLGSGAFSRIESDRSVTIQSVPDPDAYLGLDKCDTPNGSYVTIDEEGHLEVLMNPDNPTIGETPLGDGINSDSVSCFHRVFEVCNQGKESACIYIADSENWPRVPQGEPNAGERRVDFYLTDDPSASVVGVENAFRLDVGECICIGIKTRSHGLSAGDELLDVLDNQVQIIADVDLDCDLRCPNLSGQYECTTYENENGIFRRTGTRFRIVNTGPVGTTFDLAVANSPGDWRDDISIGANTTRSAVADASVPKKAIIAWEAPEGCEQVINAETWGEYKSRVGVADLTDWYSSFGSAGVPPDAPSDLADELVVEVQDIPEENVPVGSTVGPDETISGGTYPDMSNAAETEGWITCEQFNGNAP